MPPEPATTEPRPAPGTDPSAATSPPTDLTAALVAIAATAGYDIDTDELPITTGLRSDLILRWVLAGSHIIANRYMRWLLDEPVEVMCAAIDHRGVPAHTEELALVVATSDHLDHTLPALTQAFDAVCSAIAHTGLGMAWPAITTVDQSATTDLTAALRSAGFLPSSDRRYTGRRLDGAAVTIRVDTAVTLMVRPTAGPAWTATFTLTTPAPVIIAAAG